MKYLFDIKEYSITISSPLRLCVPFFGVFYETAMLAVLLLSICFVQCLLTLYFMKKSVVFGKNECFSEDIMHKDLFHGFI